MPQTLEETVKTLESDVTWLWRVLVTTWGIAFFALLVAILR